MDNYRRRRIRIVVGIVAAATIMVGVILWIAVSQSKEPAEDRAPDVQVTTDPDTGDEIVHVPGKDPEPDPFGDKVTVLGGSKLIDNTSLTYLQYDLVVAIVEEYAKEDVGDISAIKFLPDTIELRASSPSGVPTQYAVQVKTVDPEAILNTTIHLIGLDRVRLTIDNADKPELGTFDSGVRPRPNPEHDHFDGGH